MPSKPAGPYTEGSSDFNPVIFFERWTRNQLAPPHDNDFRQCIVKSFGLAANDNYRYVAVAEVTLQQVQTHIMYGAQGGMHAWYRNEEGQPKGNPTASDIAAYIDIFRPTTSTSKALTSLASNAKKDSLRSEIAKHLLDCYHAHTEVVVSKSKNHINPYFDIWAWTCQNLEWGGPEAGSARVKTSHAVLPVLYHHFGCVVPSYESLILIQSIARARRILDMGSGNGYWTYMLRRLSPLPGTKDKRNLEVLAIDNGMSQWRTLWIADTVTADGIQWLRKNNKGRDDVLLLVYPVIGQDFTSSIIKAYGGTTIISAGAQNHSGFTAFAKETIGEWMSREMSGWEQTAQIPLPSFAGKDEALFVFEKRGL